MGKFAVILGCFMMAASAVHAQFNFATNNGALTITAYTGAGGDVTIPTAANGLAITSIGTNSFENISNLASVTIPSSVTNIGNFAFLDCTNLSNVTFSNGVITIGVDAFTFCSSLTNVTLPESVTNIEGVVFAGCTNMTAITVDTNNPTFSSLNGVLFNKSQSTLVEYPAGVGGSYAVPDSVTDIGDQAFMLTALTGISIPNSVARIAAGAFVATPLTSIAIPIGVTSILDHMFFQCSSLTNVTIPDGVTNIEENAFTFCSGLYSLTIPPSVISIDDLSFVSCNSLTNVYFGGNAPIAGSRVFYGDANTTVYYLSGTTGWGSTFGGVPTELWLPFTFTTNVGTITITGYAGPGGAVTIPSTINGLPVVSIGGGAFFGNSLLTSVAIPNTVTNIGDESFFYCFNLTAVYFQGNAPGLGSSVFGSPSFGPGPPGFRLAYPNCYYLPATTGWGSTFGGCPAYLLVSPLFCTPSNGSITINGCIGSLDTLTIPGTIDGLPVTGIGNNAFAGSSLTTVIIANGITTIGDEAFEESGLTSITIPDSVTSIGADAFQGCALTNLTLPNSGDLTIGNWAFLGCNDLTSITIPNGVSSIGYYAFGACARLTNVTISGSVTSLGQFAFYQSSAITSVYFTGNAPGADWTTFMNDSAVTVYYLPGTTGWGSPFAGVSSVVLWNPQIQTGDGSFGLQNNEFGFNITGTANLSIVVEGCTNLASPAWVPIQTVSLTNGSAFFGDAEWTNYPCRFYSLGFP